MSIVRKSFDQYRLHGNFVRNEPERLVSGLSAIDELTQGGFPRGAISEIVGPDTSGRTTILHGLLAAATLNQEICAYVDTSDSFDPLTAAQSGVILQQLLWIRCRDNVEHALKVVDHLLHAGGFGLVALDLCHASSRLCRKLPMSYWHRFRLAVENTSTLLAVVDKEPLAQSCASLRLEMKRTKPTWSGSPGFVLLKNLRIEAASTKPLRISPAEINAFAIREGR
jgi:KaiC/GvpD/RAD55 family RecA-like ATPase